jgi:hypothetical protein
MEYQVTNCALDGTLLSVHVCVASVAVIIGDSCCDAATAANIPPPCATEDHGRALFPTSGGDHVIPSSEDITRADPELATAANRPPPNVTACHCNPLAAFRAVQVVPSGEDITRFVPSADTATNTPPPNATEFQVFA